MKVLIYYFPAFALCVSFACTKSKRESAPEPDVTTEQINGLPADLRINGYFHAQWASYYNFSANPEPDRIYLWAAFSDKQKMLTKSLFNFTPSNAGDVSVKMIHHHSSELAPSLNPPGVFYWKSDYIMSVDFKNSYWKTEGNASFKPLSVNVKRAFPIVADSMLPDSFNRNAFTLQVKNLAVDFDSLLLTVDRYGASLNKIRKVIAPGDTIIHLPAGVFNGYLSGEQCFVTLEATNYTHCTINNRMYVFGQTRQIYKLFVLH